MIHHGDCLDVLKTLDADSVDMVLADLPYGTTACKWDTVIPFEPLWKEMHRVCKPNAAILVFGSEPFSSALRMSNIDNFRYDWIWDKKKSSGALLANKMPMKRHEIVSVFYQQTPLYNPQKIPNPNGIERRSHYAYSKVRSFGETMRPVKEFKPSSSYEPDKLMPVSIQAFSKDAKPVHPTQKPVALLEYLIKTYTNEGDLVLDPTVGSGSTGVAAINTKRRFIGIEREAEYVAIAEKRIYHAFPEFKKQVKLD